MKIIRRRANSKLNMAAKRKSVISALKAKKFAKHRVLRKRYFSDEEADKKQALALSLGLKGAAKRKIEAIDDTTFAYNDAEYLVLTDSEADWAAEQNIESVLDDVGITSFNLYYPNFVDTSLFEEAMEESHRSYAQDISSESSDTFESRLVEECYENGLIDDSDFETDADGEPDYKQCLKDNDDLVSDLTDFMAEDNAVEWFINEFGEEEFADVVKKYHLADVRAIKDEVIFSDGRGHILSSHDGREDVETVHGEDYYIYRIN